MDSHLSNAEREAREIAERVTKVEVWPGGADEMESAIFGQVLEALQRAEQRGVDNAFKVYSGALGSQRIETPDFICPYSYKKGLLRAAEKFKDLKRYPFRSGMGDSEVYFCADVDVIAEAIRKEANERM